MDTDLNVLREAARLMRDRAAAANGTDARTPYGDSRLKPVPTSQWSGLVDGYLGGEMGTHCASWHPAVALAVADWLDAEADLHGSVKCAEGKVPDGWRLRVTSSTLPQAVAAARAYLGGQS